MLIKVSRRWALQKVTEAIAQSTDDTVKSELRQMKSDLHYADMAPALPDFVLITPAEMRLMMELVSCKE